MQLVRATPLLGQLLAKQALPASFAVSASLQQTALFGTVPNNDKKDEAPGLLRKQPGQSGFSAGFASSTEVTTTSDDTNSWTKFRAPYGLEQKSTMGAMTYAAIATFGFSLYLNDMIYHPPRVVTMMGLMMLLMWVRKG